MPTPLTCRLHSKALTFCSWLTTTEAVAQFLQMRSKCTAFADAQRKQTELHVTSCWLNFSRWMEMCIGMVASTASLRKLAKSRRNDGRRPCGAADTLAAKALQMHLQMQSKCIHNHNHNHNHNQNHTHIENHKNNHSDRKGQHLPMLAHRTPGHAAALIYDTRKYAT